MVISIIILILIIILQTYVVYNLYQKYEKLENEYELLVDKSEQDSSFILSLRSRIMSQRSYLKQLDRRGAFESDDEVGYFFKELKKIVNDISSYFNIETTEEPTVNNNNSEPMGIRGFDGN